MSFVRSPFVKWAGGKRRLVPFIAKHLGLADQAGTKGSGRGSNRGTVPGSDRGSDRRLVEPFAGGAAVSLALADRFERIWLNDLNDDLMNIYSSLQNAAKEYIPMAAELFVPETNNADTYYRLRDEFNTTESSLRKAALFLYLNRHGYNGLCRYNSSGKFNVPYGRYKNPYFPEAELRQAAEVLQKTNLTSMDFTDVMQQCGAGDVVYCDPPYVPLSETASFTSYAAGGFSMADQERLVDAAEAARERGALVAISNHDTPLTKQLYSGAENHFKSVRRMISCDGRNRNEVREVLAVFRPDSA